MSEGKEIVAKEPELIAPASVEKTLDALKRFEEFKRRVLTEDDYMPIAGKKYIKKSGWLKYALACNISLEKREEREEIRDDGTRVYHYTYRAIAPSGRFADAVGSASSDERDFAHEIHDVRALAQTRATERAVSNLVGGGELGAEELLPTEAAQPRATVSPPATKAAHAPPANIKEAEAKIEIEPAPIDEGWEELKDRVSGKAVGKVCRTSKDGAPGVRVEFDPPVDLSKGSGPFESFLVPKVLDTMRNKIEGEGGYFAYAFERNGDIVNALDIIGDVDDKHYAWLKSACAWAAARVMEKK